jgi:hypothetical protein
VRAGSVVHTTMDLGGAEHAFDLEVLHCDRPSRWQHRTNEPDYHGTIEYRFEAESSGTRVTMRCEVWPASAYGWFGLPILFRRRRRAYREQLPQLKRALE